MSQKPANYHPQFFLAALGAGGLAVSFFMYLMFWIPHPNTPMTTFNHWWPRILEGPWWQTLLIGGVLLAILLLAVTHLLLLAWNLKQLSKWRATTTAASPLTLMPAPLTLAMTINVGFILGALFVPNLWSVVEWLFPFALAGFAAVGFWAMRLTVEHYSQWLREGVQSESINHWGHLMPAFALVMVAVGMAAPAAMSHTLAIQLAASVLSMFFLAAAGFVALLQLPMGLRAVFKHGLNQTASASTWILIPILTLMGITWLRLSHGLSHAFHVTPDVDSYLLFTGLVFGLQVFVGFVGWRLMKDNGYFKRAQLPTMQPGSYALVCPGVALFVFGAFFITYGFVRTGAVSHLSPIYMLMWIPLAAVQFKTVQVFARMIKNIPVGAA